MLEGIVNFCAQPGYVRLDDAGGRVEVQTLYLLQQHRARQEAPRIAHEILEELKFCRRQSDLLPLPGALSRQ